MPNRLSGSGTDVFIPPLVLNDQNGKKSMNAMIHRHESGNMSLSLQISELLRMNRELSDAIENYLETS